MVLLVAVTLPMKEIHKTVVFGCYKEGSNSQVINSMNNCKIEGKVTLKSMMAIFFHEKQYSIEVRRRIPLQYSKICFLCDVVHNNRGTGMDICSLETCLKP